jgi:hypothetical protein
MRWISENCPVASMVYRENWDSVFLIIIVRGR